MRKANPAHIGFLLMRFWMEYRQVYKTLFLRDFLDRMLYLLAFGFGLGGALAASHGSNYFAFLVPGIAASTGVFVMTMAMTFGVYERALNYKLWPAWLATPLRLPEIMLAELIYASLRAMPSVLILLFLAYFWLDALPSVSGALLSIPVLLLANLAMGAVGLCFTSHIRRTMHFAYVNTLWTTPMFLFAGVFFDLKQAPEAMQLFANIYPLTHVLAIIRPLMLGQPLGLGTVAFSLSLLVLIFLVGYTYALLRFERKLLD